jgi:molybdenum cofactor sulfurtransferase
MILKFFQRRNSKRADEEFHKKGSSFAKPALWFSGGDEKVFGAVKDGTESQGDSSSSRCSEKDLMENYQYSPKLQEKFERIRDQDFARLDQQHCRYFDYTGGMVAPESLLRAHHIDLMTAVLGNPHSEHKPSKDATNIELEARAKVLSFCDANPDDYVVVWTPNASGALKVVGESYPFNKKGAYLYAPDCHNSLLGISRFATNKKATAKGFNFLGDGLCYDFGHFQSQVQKLGSGSSNAPKLLGICAESNVSGYVHNIKKYADFAHSHGWDVCVDAAAMAPTKKITMADLGHPEFLCMSFYKIFGYPTGTGCLVAKKTALMRLEKRWFSGGTVRLVGVSSNVAADFLVGGDRSARYEDGTINYTSLQAVTNGLNYIEAVGLEDLNRHVQYFSAVVESRLRSMAWPNGRPLVYIPTMIGEDEDRGNVFCATFLLPDGSLMPHKVIEQLLCKKGIAARTGCFCNPGSALKLIFPHLNTTLKSRNVFVERYMLPLSKHNHADKFLEENPHQGMVRFSVGLPTTMADVDALIDCIRDDILNTPEEIQKASHSYLKNAAIPYGIC